MSARVKSLTRQRRVLGSVVVSAVLLGVGGVVGASWVKSPQDAAAERAAPTPSVLSAVVEERVLADTVVVRGTVVAAGSFEVSPPLSVEGRAVVTRIPVEAGADISAGQVVAEISGRPVVVLPGTVPAYRDLRPGAEGADVGQLQAALDELGFSSGSDPEDVFGAGTQDAVEQFYESIGHPVMTTGNEDQVAAAAASVTAAARAVREAKDSLELAKEGVEARSEVADAADAAADNAVRAAEEAKEVSAADPDDLALAEAAEAAVVEADRLVEEAAAARLGASPAPGEPDPVEQARDQLNLADEDLATARSAHSQIVAESGPIVPLGEYVVVPAMPARVQAIDLGVGDEVDGPVATLASGELVVTARADIGIRDLLAEGMPASVLSELTGFDVAAVITEIGPATESETDGYGHTITVTPDGELPADLSGADMRVTVTAAQTDGAVLVVPISAVSAASDGSTIVVTLEHDGTQSRVEVTAGVSGDGFVEVVPAVDGDLAPGDRVVTGE